LATISYPSSPYCATGTAGVTQTGQAGGTYSSTAGLIIDAVTGTINLATSAPGTYTVSYIFNNGICSNTAITTIDIVIKPSLVITSPSPACTPSTVDLTNPQVTAGSTPGLIFGYYSDPAGTISLSNPSAMAISGTYYLQGSSSSSGCSSLVEPVTVVINTSPGITASSDSVICKGTGITLSASSPGNSIDWLDIGAGDSIEVMPAATTTYSAIATNASGCTDTAKVTVQVLDFTLNLSANPDPVLAGTTLNLTTSSDSNYQVLSWMPQSYFTDQTATSQSFIVKDSTQEFVVIGKSSQGCLDSAILVVNIDPNTKDFFIPNAFTPNNDGKNDIFKAYGSSIKEIDLRVFNQWGQMLFETNDPGKGWDGTYNGNPQPVGVYIYLVRAVLYGEKIITKRGTLNLIR